MKKIEKQEGLRPSARRPLRARKLWHTLLIAAVIMALLSGTALAVREIFSGIRSTKELVVETEWDETGKTNAEKRQAALAAEEEKRASVLEEDLYLCDGYLYLDKQGHLGREPALAKVGGQSYVLAPGSEAVSTMEDGAAVTVFTTADGESISVRGQVGSDRGTLSADGVFNGGEGSGISFPIKEIPLRWQVGLNGALTVSLLDEDRKSVV